MSEEEEAKNMDNILLDVKLKVPLHCQEYCQRA